MYKLKYLNFQICQYKFDRRLRYPADFCRLCIRNTLAGVSRGLPVDFFEGIIERTSLEYQAVYYSLPLATKEKGDRLPPEAVPTRQQLNRLKNEQREAYSLAYRAKFLRVSQEEYIQAVIERIEKRGKTEALHYYRIDKKKLPSWLTADKKSNQKWRYTPVGRRFYTAAVSESSSGYYEYDYSETPDYMQWNKSIEIKLTSSQSSYKVDNNTPRKEPNMPRFKTRKDFPELKYEAMAARFYVDSEGALRNKIGGKSVVKDALAGTQSRNSRRVRIEGKTYPDTAIIDILNNGGSNE